MSRKRGTDPFLGRKIARYAIQKKLGEGGMGAVYAARDLELGRDVALKLLPSWAATDVGRRRRFQREARSVSAVRHPNVAAVYDVGERDGAFYIVMELVRGTTLRSKLQERGALDVEEALRITRAIAEGLAAAHAAGVVHRDVKPENVMITDEGEIKLLDFGVAKIPPSTEIELDQSASLVTDLVTIEGQILGTPGYMAPEQARGGQATAAADVFALGVVLYEMLTGVRPFRGATRIDVLVATDRDDPDPVSQVEMSVPSELDAVVARCLKKRPEERFASAAELIAALDRPARAERPVTTTPTGNAAVSADLTPLPSEASRAPSRSRWATNRAAWALAAIAAVVTFDRAAPAPPPPSLGAPVPPVLACPPLAVRGPDADRWIGAAAASFACTQIALRMGGRVDRTLFPAMLLDLPHVPTSGAKLDPYGSEDARTRALTAARARAELILDGTVERVMDGFRVSLHVEGPRGERRTPRSGAGTHLSEAMLGALEGLTEEGPLRRVATVDPSVAAWFGTTETSALVAWFETVEHTMFASPPSVCADRDAIRRTFGSFTPLVDVECALEEGAVITPIAIDRSSPGALALTSRYHVMSGGAAAPRAIAQELNEARAHAQSPLGEALLAEAEAEMLQAAGEAQSARDRAIVAVSIEPRLRLSWGRLMSLSISEPSTGAVARAYAAWLPDSPVPWRWLAVRDVDLGLGHEGATRDQDRATRITFARRANLLAPRYESAAIELSSLLIASGEREEARALAASFLTGRPGGRDAGELMMASVEASEARFDAALARAKRVLDTAPVLGNDVSHMRLVALAIEIGFLLGREREIGGTLASRIVGPARGLGRQLSTPQIAIAACALAPQPLSKRCFSRLRELVAEGHFVSLLPSFGAAIAGAEPFAEGKYNEAASAWRVLARSGGPIVNLIHDALAEAFERAGERELAELVDGAHIERAAATAGATTAHVRAAKRAAATGDRARARAIAKQVIGAWSVADVAPPALTEMRVIAGKGP